MVTNAELKPGEYDQPAEAVLLNEKLESISHDIEVPICHATCR